MAEAALEVLGPDRRFSTELLVTGPIHEGVLAGDVVLRGGGDPDLQVTDLLGLAGKLAEAGVRRVDRPALVDDSALPRLASINAAEFPIDDPYNAGIGALGVGFDRVKLRWRRPRQRDGRGLDHPAASRGERSSPRRPALCPGEPWSARGPTPRAIRSGF